MISIFENWYNSLSEVQQKELLDHVFNKKIKFLNEGFFTGPAGKLERGLFTGPVNNQRKCPNCGKNI